jgi:hypothetical protein
VNDRGYSLAAGAGLSPSSRLSILFGLERSHVSSRSRTDNRGTVSSFRGGTLTAGTLELRVAPLGRERLGPYVAGGFAIGVSRPNVTPAFPGHLVNDVRAFFVGGGVHVPLSEDVSLFADGRMMGGAEAGELLALTPVRAGVAWRF